MDSSGLRSLLLARAAAIQAGAAFYISEASPVRRHWLSAPGSGACSWTIDKNWRRPPGERAATGAGGELTRLIPNRHVEPQLDHRLERGLWSRALSNAIRQRHHGR
jgi:hypothetical protein